MKIYELKNGDSYRIRKAEKADAPSVINYVNSVAGESDFLTFGEGEFDISVEREKTILEQHENSNNSLYLLAEMNGVIIGSLNFNGGSRPRTKHFGEFGVSVSKAYWGNGIGRALIESLIQWAKESDVVKKINLKVRADHEKGIHLYESIGFKREGTVKKFFYTKGNYYDVMEMGLEIN